MIDDFVEMLRDATGAKFGDSYIRGSRINGLLELRPAQVGGHSIEILVCDGELEDLIDLSGRYGYDNGYSTDSLKEIDLPRSFLHFDSYQQEMFALCFDIISRGVVETRRRFSPFRRWSVVNEAMEFSEDGKWVRNDYASRWRRLVKRWEPWI